MKEILKKLITKGHPFKNTDFIIQNTKENVCLSQSIKHTASEIRIINDLTAASSGGGYCTTKTSHGIQNGKWYYECTIDGSIGNFRIGWAQIIGEVNAPVGFDEFGYCYTDKGNFMHCSRKTDETGEPFGFGDVIGCVIYIPENTNQETSEERKKEIKTKYPPLKRGSYLITQEFAPGAYIEYYKNGTFIGRPFLDIYYGKYYPSISIYGKGVISVNFGPNFFYSVPSDTIPFINIQTKTEIIPEPSTEI